MAAAVTARTRRSPQRGVAPGRRAGRVRWDRVSRIALLAMLAVILLLYVSPAKHWLEQSSTRAAQHAELSRLKSEHAGLERKVRAFRDPGSLEREARRLGMIERGERGYVIENPPGD
jgi:cell division protein FtsB